MKKRRGFLRLLMRPINPASIGLQGFFSVLVGFWLMLPWDTYNLSPTYKWLAALSPDWVPGILLLGAGVIMLWGAWTNRAKPIIVTSWIGYSVWTAISILLLIANAYSILWILAVVPAVHCAFIALNVNLNKGIMPLELE
jgi:hypothetical protein